MARVIWRDQAADDLDRIIAYIRQSNPRAATKIGVRLHNLGETLSARPNRGRPITNGARELVTVRPYVLRYRLTGEMVEILHIRHSSRRPLKT